ncbi:CMRF35-like molecule 8 [Echinops telfairi]|uniref:CMRF35-like molecule 8 n=1 Tax=Echinops telfairi TaxID=9371 RepID=A0AC59C6Y6_ECHTE|nr:CMRF35-like molecule 8 [Echinops telfairi]
MRARRRKAAQRAQLSRNHSLPQLDEPGEPCYANLELQTWPSGTAPEQQRDVEVEYSTVAAPMDEVDYTSVTFALPSQGPEAPSTALERPREEPEYSVVKKPSPPSQACPSEGPLGS